MPEKRPGFVVNFIVRAIVGMSLIFFINEFLSSKGMDVAVGYNLISLLTTGTLGVPGVAMLYGIVLFPTL